jgi:nucleotide-binding universal stress UspA family protein
MIRSILIGLDQSPYTRAATDLGVAWAKRFDAVVTGVAVIDEPRIRADLPGRIGGGGYYKFIVEGARMNHAVRGAGTALDEFRRGCEAAGVKFQTRRETGDPAEVLLGLHDDYDVTLLGRETWFRFATQDPPDEVLTEVLRHARRPVVVVPEAVPAAEAVLVAYDGSPAAVDALQSFAASGLGVGRPVTVVCADPDKTAANRRADEAARFLAYHDVRATARPLASDADDADTLAAAAESADAGMVVMGAFSRGRLREWFRPSVTARMLARPGRLLYLHHHPN